MRDDDGNPTSVLDIVTVWSSYGHTFLSEDTEDDDEGNAIGIYVSCLDCGAHYVLRLTPDGWSDGDYRTASGDEPDECTGDTSMVHGDPRENGHDLDCPDGCEHCGHECPCLLCA